jgi:AraC-like DNA-binding protein
MTSTAFSTEWGPDLRVPPATGPAPWDISALRHQRLDAGAHLPDAAGPLWVLVLDGAGTLQTASGTQHLGVGDAVLIDAHTAYRLTAAEGGAELAVADLRLVLPPFPVPSPLVVRDFARRHHGVNELVRTCPLGVECAPTVFAASYGGLIGASMVAAWLDDNGRDAQDPLDDPVGPAVAAVVAALAAYPAEQWTVERMAGLVHLSRSARGERFRRELGRSPVRVLREIRMQQARRLLTDRDRSVEQVGHAVGYGSAAAFTRAFSTHHGVAPNAWRATSTASTLRHSKDGEAGTAGGRARGADEQGSLHLLRVDDDAPEGRAERDGDLEGRHLQRQR